MMPKLEMFLRLFLSFRFPDVLETFPTGIETIRRALLPHVARSTADRIYCEGLGVLKQVIHVG